MLTVQYDGSKFCGYELQPNGNTIRFELENALNSIFNGRIKIIATSRTDSGVHALMQVINFETTSQIPAKNITKALNSMLPEEIRIINSREAKNNFNARFDVKQKTYEYLIYNEEVLPPFIKNYVWHVKPKIDLNKMKKASRYLEGSHDFESFCAAHGDDTDFVRTLSKIEIRYSIIEIWSGFKIPVIRCKITGDGFLYKMVRNIVGTLVDVGIGNIKFNDMKKILNAKDRKLAGRCAPAQGLCLIEVKY